jgi:hypothetical protein
MMAIEFDRVALRIAAPSVDALQKAIDASWACESNPGSIGVDLEANAYFAVKKKDDMISLLKYLAAEGNNSLRAPHKAEDFKLVQLTYPKGVF